MTIGLIGYGRFGRLAARYISRRASLVVYDTRPVAPRHVSRRIRRGSLSEAASQKVVILAVPISSLRGVLRRIGPLVVPRSLVLDVCAAKVIPIRWMKELLPRNVFILGTHPLFGPGGMTGSPRGQRVILCPVRITHRLLSRVERLVRREGLIVERMTPDRHDRMIAETVLLTQYVGRLVSFSGIRKWPAVTPTYEKLRSLEEVARSDTDELFRDMWEYNAYSRRLGRALTAGRARVERVRRR